MDMMSFDVAYALGPLLGVTVATQAGCRAALGLVAVLLAAGGAVLGAVVGPSLPPARFRTAAAGVVETPAGPEAAGEVTDGPGEVADGGRRRATGGCARDRSRCCWSGPGRQRPWPAPT